MRALRKALPLLFVLVAAAPPALAGGEVTVRPEIGQPLLRARTLTQAGRFAEANTELARALAVPNRDANESFLIEQTRAAVASAAGDRATAAASTEAMIRSGRVSGGNLLALYSAEVSYAWADGDYARASGWLDRYRAAGGRDPALEALRIRAAYQLGDDATAIRLSRERLAAAEAAARKPEEGDLLLLLAAEHRHGDAAGEHETLARLAHFHPKPSYWEPLIRQAESQPGFARRLGPDVARLRLAVGAPATPGVLVGAAEQALADNAPWEARRLLAEAQEAGRLPPGPDAGRAGRLLALAEKRIADWRQHAEEDMRQAHTAPDGDALLALGEAHVALGETEAGIALIRGALTKGGLRHPDDARLHLALALLATGQDPAAKETLRQVAGLDGTAELARLWLLR